MIYQKTFSISIKNKTKNRILRSHLRVYVFSFFSDSKLYQHLNVNRNEDKR